MDGAQNVVLIGGPGTGKTHAATALGVQAVEHHRRKVRFFSTIELVNALEQEKAKGKAGQLAEGLTKLDLVILDELGYLPFSASGGALLFHLLSKLYERTSVVICAFHVSWAPIPRDRGHSFHDIVGSHSTRSWAAGLTDRFIDSGLLCQVKA
jgi:DNA replication protein DnaC